VSLDGSWRFLDISVGRCLKVVKEESSNIATGVLEYTSCAFHPDGLIMGTGTAAGLLKVWDIREQVNVANCAEHTGAVNSISFSENGYLVATGSSDGDVKIWDLRKLQCTRTLDGESLLVCITISC
jgi:pre-mRNA-processing factor 19